MEQRGAGRARRARRCDEPARFTRDRHETEVFWLVREGMQGIVGAMRPQGTALIIEDVCVPPERIAEATHDIQALLGEHGFLHRRGRPRRAPATCTSC